MKKEVVLLGMVILLALTFPVNAEPYYTSSTITTILETGGSIDVIEESRDSSIEYVRVNVSHFPRATASQTISNLVTVPGAIIGKENYLFEYLEPTDDPITFSTSARVTSRFYHPAITDKIPFPLRDIDEDVMVYTLPTGNVDSTDEDIILAASLIASGKDDLYVVASTIAYWVGQNIQYSLSTLTAEASQSASWVLVNKKGVCDELSTLYIAMMRTLGVPARYVSGLAYTNHELFDEGYGAHGWAEVWFPGHGWVPFDITYREYGYIDAAHIILKTSADTNEPAMHYYWRGIDIDMESSRLKSTASPIDFGRPVKKSVSLDVSFLREVIDLGSYNVMEVTIENKESHYVNVEMTYLPSKGTSLLSSETTFHILGPRQKDTAYFIIKVDDLDPDFIYTFTLGGITNRNVSSQKTFQARKDRSYITEDDALAYVRQRQGTADTTRNAEVDFSCTPENDFVYLDETLTITCVVENEGNLLLEGMEVCLDTCIEFSLPIAQEVTMDIDYSSTVPGTKELFISLKHPEVSKLYPMSIRALDEPDLAIAGVDLPSIVEYKQPYTITFDVSKLSSSNPQDLTINLRNQGYSRSWKVPELQGNKQFILNMVATGMEPGQNPFNLTVTYHDERGNTYQHREIVMVTMGEVDFLEGLEIQAQKLSDSLGILMLLVILFIAIFFILTMIYVLHPRRRHPRAHHHQHHSRKL